MHSKCINCIHYIKRGSENVSFPIIGYCSKNNTSSSGTLEGCFYFSPIDNLRYTKNKLVRCQCCDNRDIDRGEGCTLNKREYSKYSLSHTANRACPFHSEYGTMMNSIWVQSIK